MDDRISLGVDTNCVPDIEETLQFSRSSGYDFISVPLVHPRYRRPFDALVIKRDEPLTRSDTLLGSNDWTTSVIGKISPWLDCDSESAAIRTRSEKVCPSSLLSRSELRDLISSHFSLLGRICPHNSKLTY
jgi:protein arginine N-methyltransferase 5